MPEYLLQRRKKQRAFTVTKYTNVSFTSMNVKISAENSLESVDYYSNRINYLGRHRGVSRNAEVVA